MMMGFKTVVFTGSLLLTISAFGYLYWQQPVTDTNTQKYPFEFFTEKVPEKTETLVRVKEKASQAKAYISDHGFDEEYCFLLDMTIASGKNRFFVYNLKKDSVALAGLVTHGSGSENGSEALHFSNTPNSHSTSLGKYKIGNAYYGIFGLAYKLHGLDQTNNKAFERFIVLHAHECVPDKEIFPSPVCLSQGCPTVSELFLIRLKEYIDGSSAPIMMWLYN